MLHLPGLKSATVLILGSGLDPEPLRRCAQHALHAAGQLSVQQLEAMHDKTEVPGVEAWKPGFGGASEGLHVQGGEEGGGDEGTEGPAGPHCGCRTAPVTGTIDPHI